jgi:pimeloyl-ACP methyl ester carboxylesterase
MPFYEKGPVRIYYEETGSGFPLFLIPGGGLNSVLGNFNSTAAFQPFECFKNDYRCIGADLRNALSGQSSGPIEIDRPWDAFADDQLGLLDHLGVHEFMVMGFCIGGPMIYNLIKHAPDRVVAAAVMQPVGVRPEKPTLMYDTNVADWPPKIREKRPDLSQADAEAFIRNMYQNKDFVVTVTRDFIRNMQTPILIAPDDIPAHPYSVAMETAGLAPHVEVTIYPWKDTPEHVDETVEHVRRFLKSHRPAHVS